MGRFTQELYPKYEKKISGKCPILSVTNVSSPEDAEFYPVCQLITDTFKAIPADKHVPISVFETVKRKHQGSYPFLESLDFKDHRVSRGEDNTRDFAIIWPDFDPKARQVSLFVGGLSNETAVLKHPKLKDEDGGPKKIFLWLRSISLLGGVTECIYCLSFWVGLGLYALMYYEYPEPVYVFGIVGASHLLASWTGANYATPD